jgi:myo-inositol 2-dehydrogenase/D-chiro-inositol 1-dehydrogenase
LYAQGRHINSCWDFFGDVIQGAKGSAILGEGQPRPRLYKAHRQITEDISWQYTGPAPDPYQVEHDLLFDAIRNDKPYNEAERCAKSCMTAIMGRMACESGKMITWDEALASNVVLAPGLAEYTWESNPPVLPDSDGHYPIAMPGLTQVL